MAGHNYRLTDLQAAVVIPQLEAYPEQLRRRRANAARLTDLLGDIDGLILPTQLEGREHVWHQYTVLLPAGVDRDGIIASLAEQGVSSGIYYPKPVYDYETYSSRSDVIRSATPIADEVALRCLSLPVHPYLTADELTTIGAAVHTALGE